MATIPMIPNRQWELRYSSHIGDMIDTMDIDDDQIEDTAMTTDCYGHYRDNCAGRCEYAESCAYISRAQDPETAGAIRGRVEYDRNAWRVPAPDPIETDDDDDALDRLEDVLRYILGLDVMTLAIIGCIVDNPNATQTDIARAMGVSRQNVHTAVIRACHKHPELRQVFALLARKLTLTKTRYPRR